MRTFINEQKPVNLTAAARLTDEYSLTLKFSASKAQNQPFPRGSNNLRPEGQQPSRHIPRIYPENANGDKIIDRNTKLHGI